MERLLTPQGRVHSMLAISCQNTPVIGFHFFKFYFITLWVDMLIGGLVIGEIIHTKSINLGKLEFFKLLSCLLPPEAKEHENVIRYFLPVVFL